MDRDDVIDHVNEMGMDSYPIEITYSGESYVITENRDNRRYGNESAWICDVAEEYLTRSNDRGEYAGSFAGFDVYEYHASFSTPHAANYEDLLIELENGDLTRVVIALEPLEETWILAVRAESKSS